MALLQYNFSIPSTTFPPHVKPFDRGACGLRPDHRHGREGGECGCESCGGELFVWLSFARPDASVHQLLQKRVNAVIGF